MKPQAVDMQWETAEALAIEALGFVAGRPEALGRFLAISGLGPSTLRRAAADPGFLVGVLDFLAADEPLLLAFASHADIPPERIGQARRVLSRTRGRPSDEQTTA
jgi:hypothetical protein